MSLANAPLVFSLICGILLHIFLRLCLFEMDIDLLCWRDSLYVATVDLGSFCTIFSWCGGIRVPKACILNRMFFSIRKSFIYIIFHSFYLLFFACFVIFMFQTFHFLDSYLSQKPIIRVKVVSPIFRF